MFRDNTVDVGGSEICYVISGGEQISCFLIKKSYNFRVLLTSIFTKGLNIKSKAQDYK